MRAGLVLLAGAALSLSSVPMAQAATDPPVPAESDQGAPATGEAPPPSDRIIVRWAPGVSRADRVQTRSAVNTEDLTNLGNAKFQLLSLADGQDPDQAVRELKANPDVANVSRDGYSTLHAPAPNDPLFNQLWGLDNKGLNIGGVGTSTSGVDIDALAAWGKTTGDKSVIVAVLDTGIRPNHPDLKNRIWTNPDETPGDGIDNDANGIVDDVIGADFVGADAYSPSPDKDPTDDIPQGGHGVHTAGTIGAEGNNGQGITGVAQKTSLMGLRVCGWDSYYSGVNCPYSSQIAAINYAGAKGAKVANMSLGGYGGNTLVRDAIARNPKTLFVISAGNDAFNNDTTPAYPCSFDPTTSGIAGAVDNIVCVAATDQSDGVASFSNWGKTKVDIGAPGTETLSSFVTKDMYTQDFESSGSLTGWVNNGFVRTNSSPLTSYGITNSSSTQSNSTTRTARTPNTTVTGPTQCRLNQRRTVSLSASDKYTYRILVDGSQVFSSSPADSGSKYADFSVSGAGSHTVAAEFSYLRSGGTNTNGVWLDDLKVSCYGAPGQEDSTSYAFLEGTSMAAPHVAGVAALLAAYEPNATVLQMRQALLSSVDPLAVLNPSTGSRPVSSGGRLNADKALAAVDALVAPDTNITAGTTGTVADGSAAFEFVSDAKTPVTFECALDADGFTGCSSPFSVTGLGDGNHTFQVRARDLSSASNADTTPASAAWTVALPKTQLPTLTAPAKVTGIKVKRKKRTAIVKWKPVPSATSYEVRLGKKTKTTSRTKYTLKKLKPKKKYTVKVWAVNPAGKSPIVNVKIKKAKKAKK